MATNDATGLCQATLAEYQPQPRPGVHEFERGELLRDTASGSTVKWSLTECPMCAADPCRERYRFVEQESRADHFRQMH